VSKAPATKMKFVAVPVRALNDERLAARHWRVLMAIAYHDRLGKNGQGCWATNQRLAELTGLSYNRVAEALSDLRAWGYITSEINPDNRNYRIHRVIYDDPTPTQSGSGPGALSRGAITPTQAAKGLAQPLPKTTPNPYPPHCGKSLKPGAGIAPKHMLLSIIDRYKDLSGREADCAEAQTSEEGREAKEAITYLANAESLLKSPSERSILRYEITKLTAMADDPGLPEHICERARQLLTVAKAMQ
jgi:hypothetical protein